MNTFYHVTDVRNAKSIFTHGLLKSKSRQKAKRVWMCFKGRIGWAMVHVALGHDIDIRDVIVFELRCNERKLGKHRPGLRFSREDVPPSQIVRIVPPTEIFGG